MAWEGSRARSRWRSRAGQLPHGRTIPRKQPPRATDADAHPQPQARAAGHARSGAAPARVSRRARRARPALTDIHHQGFAPEGCPTMESMGRKRPRRRRSFTPEFKAEIVELFEANSKIKKV